MVKAKPAATIMLARDRQGILEVLLVRRNKALAFAGGLWVFPGGKIEPNEIEKSEDELAAAKLAAVRETKEETNLDIDISNLIYFRHWTTPISEPRRFATWFFFGGVNHSSSEVTIDDSEIKEHIWLQPQAALDQLKQGQLAMMPPTIMSLQLIRKCKTVSDVNQKLRNEPPLSVLPVVRANEGKMFCLYEGDAAYESGDLDAQGARHRLIINKALSDFTFEYSNCEQVPPVNGGMHE